MFDTSDQGFSPSFIPSISVVTYLWSGGKDYSPESVNVLYGMFRRNCPQMTRFICVTDGFDDSQFAKGIEVVPTPKAAKKVAGLETPNKPHAPSCYRRLYTFSEQAREWGEWVFQTDVDCVVTGSIEPLLHDPQDFVGWRPITEWRLGIPRRVGGGSFLLRTGSRTEVWERFARRPDRVIDEAVSSGFRGSDQAVMSLMLRGCAVWPKDCGIYRIGDFEKLNPYAPLDLVEGTKIVHFLGPNGGKPWNYMHIPWVEQNWRV